MEKEIKKYTEPLSSVIKVLFNNNSRYLIGGENPFEYKDTDLPLQGAFWGF